MKFIDPQKSVGAGLNCIEFLTHVGIFIDTVDRIRAGIVVDFVSAIDAAAWGSIFTAAAVDVAATVVVVVVVFVFLRRRSDDRNQGPLPHWNRRQLRTAFAVEDQEGQ